MQICGNPFEGRGLVQLTISDTCLSIGNIPDIKKGRYKAPNCREVYGEAGNMIGWQYVLLENLNRRASAAQPILISTAMNSKQ